MAGELQVLVSAARDLELQADHCSLDPVALRQVIDRLEKVFCTVVDRARERGDHLVQGNLTAVGWLARSCALSRHAAADRLCVGEQLGSLPRIASALSSGEIGYQAASVICHLQDKLGAEHGRLDEEQWVEWARRFSIKELGELALHARHVADPEGFARDVEEDFEMRRLDISRMRNLYVIDGTLDAEGGAALKSALESLARRHPPDDVRSAKQRRADALVELVHRALDSGSLPRRNGVRPHLAVTTTLEGLKGELGAPASELESGLPVSSLTTQRLACEATVSRVLLAGSVVIDVGRATRVVSPAMKRALRARDQGCRVPGCERPVGWCSAHHVEFWARDGGPTRLSNLVLLCWYHHRCVHEGGWQVVKAGAGFRFIPPERVLRMRARGPGWWRAA